MGSFPATTSILFLVSVFSSVQNAFGLPYADHRPRSTTLNSSYLNVEFGQPRSDIDTYSNSTMSWVASQDYLPDGITKTGLFALTEWDLEHSTKTYEEVVNAGNERFVEDPGFCNSYYKVPLVNSWNPFPSLVALGILEAQEAYYDNSNLTLAEVGFQFVSDHGYISQAAIDAGYLVGTKSSSNHLSATCNGKSMLGGVYARNGCPEEAPALVNATVSAEATCSHALLGAQLCRLTKNNTYCDEAYSSLQWVDRILKRSDGLIGNEINASDCKLGNIPRAFNSAFYFAAYADLGNYTNNMTAISLGQDAAIAAMTTSEWNDNRGIITAGVGKTLNSNGFKLTAGPALIRYLHQSYQYFDADTQAAIIQYINIQYYAITQLDSNSPTAPQMYGRNWTGPAYEIASNVSMVAVLDVLNGISLNPDSAFPTIANKSAPVAKLSS